jgi:hypothetical protein
MASNKRPGDHLTPEQLQARVDEVLISIGAKPDAVQVYYNQFKSFLSPEEQQSYEYFFDKLMSLRKKEVDAKFLAEVFDQIKRDSTDGQLLITRTALLARMLPKVENYLNNPKARKIQLIDLVGELSKIVNRFLVSAVAQEMIRRDWREDSQDSKPRPPGR